MLQPPQLTLPTGGGAIRSIDEKFRVNAVNGTAGLSIPLPFSAARGFAPSLSLDYDSGAGNGIFGMGWRLALATIKRKTENGLPQYHDAADSDTFQLSGADDLVPVFQKDDNGQFVTDANGRYQHHEFDHAFGTTTYRVRYYRPRIEGVFLRIERWTAKDTGIVYWRTVSATNVTTLFGSTENGRLSQPGNDRKTAEWLPEFMYDDKGNCAVYEYKAESGTGMDEVALYNKNRLSGNAPFTNRYLKKILYGNITPFATHTDPVPTDFMFQTVFDYGEHDLLNPPFAEVAEWPFRTDAFSDYRAGFERRTARLCRRVLLYHHFAQLPGGSAVVRSLDLTYSNNGAEGFTFLREACLTGYTRHDDGSYTQKSFPPLSFDYQPHQWNHRVDTIAPADLAGAPAGIDGKTWQLIDLYSEGLPGLLTEQAQAWFYKRNLGEGHFSAPLMVRQKPSFAGLASRLQLMELEGNGEKQAVHWQHEPKGFFEATDEEDWRPFCAFERLPSIDFSDSNTRLVDLNGDGQADILITGQDTVCWYPSQGKKGFAPPETISNTWDEEKGPAMVFADGTQSVFLADMSGDGLMDLVRIRRGEVCYWPQLGHGRFGARVSMDNAPLFDEDFDPTFVKLADVDGSGTTDLIYHGQNNFRIWLNRQGNSFSPEPKIIATVPGLDNETSITVTDLLGTGMACIVWNNPGPGAGATPLRYINLFDNKKPHLLTAYRNNWGKEVALSYTPSTHYYLADKKAGTPWRSQLHFPVHCLSKVVVYDRIQKTRLASEYTYHHGHYDKAEKEFRGFGRVDQKDAETVEHFVRQSGGMANNAVEAGLHQPPVLTRTWFHTGAAMANDGQAEFDDYFTTPAAGENWPPQTTLPSGLSPHGRQEALRACKGTLVRKEVYALDDDAVRREIPYLVEQHRCTVQSLQPKGGNRHGVFHSHQSEVLTWHYERNTADPRISHQLTLAVDEWGNPLQEAAVVYPRRPQPGNAPQQAKTQVVYTEKAFTNAVEGVLDYRAPVLYSTKHFELSGLTAPAPFFELPALRAFATSAAVIRYHEEPDGSEQKRLVQYHRRQYRNDAGTIALPFGNITAKALVHQSFQAAFSLPMLAAEFGSKIPVGSLQAMLTSPATGGYVLADDILWAPSGTQSYDAAHFYLPVQVTDAFGNSTAIAYDTDYFLFIKKLTDAVQNERSVEGFNYRTLQPYRLKDSNDNISAIRFNELGLVTATFLIGKKSMDEGDQFDDAKVEPKDAAEFPSVQISYQLNEWHLQSTAPGFDPGIAKPRPVFVKATKRDTHYGAHPLHQSAMLESYLYYDGSANVLLTKNAAEPGPAIQVNADGTVTNIADTSPALRWVGNGRTILNNKGKPVKQYEPYFSTTPAFDDEKDVVHLGVTPVLHYDPLGRLVQTDNPGETFQKTVFTPWLQAMYDANDTVKESGWFAALGSPDPALPEPAEEAARAAWLAAKHHNTPTLSHLDTLGRVFLVETDNGSEKIQQRTVYDSEGHEREVWDGLNKKVAEYRYDMQGHKISQLSPDAGRRLMLANAAGQPLFLWDDRDHFFSYTYDALQRPLTARVSIAGADAVLYQKTSYGEGAAADKSLNLRGNVHRQADQSGMAVNAAYDFKGNLCRSSKRFATNYKTTLNWSNEEAVALETTSFEKEVFYDALNRPVRLVAPHASGSAADEIFHRYAVSGHLAGVDVRNKGAAAIPFAVSIQYDAKGQRESIRYGNGTVTQYTYEKETFRLKRLQTTRNAGAVLLQDLHYTYDPVGNVTAIRDDARPAVFFDGENVQPLSRFSYDAIYQLASATGRKHAGQTDLAHQRADFRYGYHPFIPSNTIHPNDSQAFRNYREEYTYDKSGNLTEQKHTAKDSSWTRTLTGSATRNQLAGTTAGGFSFNYTYDAHGNLQAMEHLAAMVWNFRDQLTEADLGGGGRAFYVYDATGQRVRKVIERLGGEKKDRLYLDGFEVYRESDAGGTVTTQRDTLHVTDDQRRMALVETPVIQPAGNNESFIIRYQHDNHLHSATLEVDEAGLIISYEEYFPFGTTAYSSTTSAREVAAKRYRYTGKERDEESGLCYHGARFYAPWLCRWTAADPIGIKDGLNVYRYVSNNPVKKVDKNGLQEDDLRFRHRTPLVGPLRLDDSVLRWRPTLPAAGDGPAADSSGVTSGRVSVSGDLHVAPLDASVPVSVHADTTVRSFGEGRLSFDARGLFTTGTIGSGIWASTTFQLSGSMPEVPRLRLDDVPGTLGPNLPRTTADLRFDGSVQAGGFSLGEYSGTAHLHRGRFELNADVRSIGSIAQVNLSGSGTLTPGGGADLQASARLRLFGIPSLSASGSGSVSPTGEVQFGGTFSGYVPPVSYAFGQFNYSSRAGLSGSATVLGATYTPSIDVRDPSPLPAIMRETLRLPADPEAPSGLTIGASHSWMSRGAFGHISGGWMPTTDDPVRFGAYASVPFSFF